MLMILFNHNFLEQSIFTIKTDILSKEIFEILKKISVSNIIIERKIKNEENQPKEKIKVNLLITKRNGYCNLEVKYEKVN